LAFVQHCLRELRLAIAIQ